MMVETTNNVVEMKVSHEQIWFMYTALGRSCAVLRGKLDVHMKADEMDDASNVSHEIEQLELLMDSLDEVNPFLTINGNHA